MTQQKFKLNSAGMSLMEILIVLGIIGGLMAFIIPQVMGNRDKAMISETKVIMGSVIAQLNMYYTDCGKYPESLDGLTTADPSCSNWGPEPYFKKLPKDKWNNDFSYSPEGSSFILKSLGADRREGGDGKNADISSEQLE